LPTKQGYFKILKRKNIMVNEVKEIPDPFEGQQAIAQDGTHMIYRKGQWIPFKMVDTMTRTVEAFGDCA
jgi:hypothetical protein